MKEIHIECAGAGKTFGIAERIVQMIEQCPHGKKIYAITYTNYAVSQIRGEILKSLHYIPDEVEIDTVHGFLLEHIIYPFSPFIKSMPIQSCSIEKLDSNVRWRAARKKQLKDKGIIHSEEVTKYSKSIVVLQSGDCKKIKQRKEIAIQYLISDMFALFVDEAQDMDAEFFDLMRTLVSRIEHFCFVGDPNQDLWGRNQYSSFLAYIRETYHIDPIFNLVSRRLPQKVIPLCNKILKPEFQISSCNKNDGVIEYIFASELGTAEKSILSDNASFSMVKSSEDIFITKAEKAISLPHEFKEILKDRFTNYDIDAVALTAIEAIKKNGLSSFLNCYGLHIDAKIYAKVMSQFNSTDKNAVPVESIHKLKGLENETVFFILCNSLLEILLGLKNDFNKETNLLYVALTRTKSKLLLIILDDDTTKGSFANRGISIDEALHSIGVFHAEMSTWFIT